MAKRTKTVGRIWALLVVLWSLWRRVARRFRLVSLRLGRYLLKTVLWVICFATLFSAVHKLIKLPPAVRKHVPEALKGIVISPDIHIWILFLIAGLAGVFGMYTDDLIRRLKKLPGGVELATGGGIAEILSVHQPPSPERELAPGASPIKGLSGEERMFYDRAAHLFWALELSGLDVPSLQGQERKNYIEIVHKTGYYAYKNEEYFKAIQFLKKLEDLEPLPKKELSLLAGAYLWAAYELLDNKQSSWYRLEAVRLYELALEENKYDFRALYNLAWVYDEVGLYAEAIRANERVIELSSSRGVSYFIPATYNIAVSCAKSGNFERALRQLSQIPKNATWEDQSVWELAKDDTDLRQLREHPEYRDRFEILLRERLGGLG